MDINEPARWVRQFADEIAAEPDPLRRCLLLHNLALGAQREVTRLKKVTAYDLRAAGVKAEDAGTALRVSRQAATIWAKQYAMESGLPAVTLHAADRPMDVVTVDPAPR